MISHVNPGDSMGFALKRLQQTLRTHMDAALAGYGLTTPQYAVLALLAEHPGMSNAELARRNYVAAPTMLRILDGLEQAGLVTRTAVSPERRVRETVLTGSGSAQLAAASAHVQEFEDLLVGSAAPDQVETIMTWLRTCAEKLGDRAIL